MVSSLPLEHVFIQPSKRPTKIGQIFRVYFRKWLVHPIKRRVAKYYALILQSLFGLKIISVTGSAGKTTTKDMLVSIFKTQGETKASYANIDPVFNIPSTILRCSPSTRYLILEMGVEFPGEIDFYHWLIKPLVGIITNIYPTHLLFFQSVDGVYKEKSKLIRWLPKEGKAILNTESNYTKQLSKLTKAKTILFGKGGLVRSNNFEITKDFGSQFKLSIEGQEIDIKLPVLGEQFVNNALAAASAAYSLGVSISDIKLGLEKFSPAEHRMRFIKHKSGAIIINDSYNNNPEAAKAALKVFSLIAKKAKKIIVFGDMLELGKDEDRYHQEIAKEIKKLNVDKVIGVGKATKKMKIKMTWFSKAEDSYSILKPLLKKNTVILVKGSRSIGLEKLISKL